MKLIKQLNEASNPELPESIKSILKKYRGWDEGLTTFQRKGVMKIILAAYKMGFDDADEEFNEPNR